MYLKKYKNNSQKCKKMKWKNKKYLMKFYAKAMSVLVKLEFRQKIKCQTSLKRGKTRGKTTCREEGISSRKGDTTREGEKGESP